MANDNWGFKVVGNPPLPGRVIGSESKPKQGVTNDVEQVVKSLDNLLNARFDEFKEILNKESLPVLITDFKNGISNLPFDKKKQIQMLTGISLYLQAQLAAVNKELNKVKSEEFNEE